MALKLRGTVLMKVKPTMTTLSGIGQGNPVTFVMVTHQALIWAMVRVTESPNVLLRWTGLFRVLGDEKCSRHSE